MSRAPKLDMDFNKTKFAEDLATACGSRTQREYAKLSGVTPGYLSMFLNKKCDNPPTPATIQRFALNAENGISYGQLLESAGYDPLKYTSELLNSESMDVKNSYQKLELAIILMNLANNVVNWKLQEVNYEDTCISKIEFENHIFKRLHLYLCPYVPIADSITTYTSFLGFQTAFSTMYAKETEYDTKFSLVTTNRSVFDIAVNSFPPVTGIIVTVVLVDFNTLSIIDERTLSEKNDVDVEQLKRYIG